MSPTKFPSFLDRLQTICEVSQAGTYFDEGGCWGMALALHAAMEKSGYSPTLQVQTQGVIGVQVVIGDMALDYRGPRPFDPTDTHRACTPANLLSIAESFGAPAESVIADQRWSEALIEAAQAWESSLQAKPSRRAGLAT